MYYYRWRDTKEKGKCRWLLRALDDKATDFLFPLFKIATACFMASLTLHVAFRRGKKSTAKPSIDVGSPYFAVLKTRVIKHT